MSVNKKRDLLMLYERMVLIRTVELRLGRLFAGGEVPGFIHLSVGQEAVAVGVASVLGTDDTVASTHRGHGHALAKGINLDEFFMELMAREEGVCKGRGGSMHVANMSIGMLGANAIVGASVPIATGSALAHQVKKTKAIAVAFFGDGAMAEGVLHESINLAALWKLPMLFVCENNGWAEFSPTHRQFSASLEKLAVAFGVAYAKADGRNVLDVRGTAVHAIKSVREGKGPTVLEFTTHRFRGHYEGDPQKYRDPEEIEGLAQHDPLLRFESILAENGVTDANMDKVKKSIETRVEQSVKGARNGSTPFFLDGSNDVYTRIGAASHG